MLKEKSIKNNYIHYNLITNNVKRGKLWLKNIMGDKRSVYLHLSHRMESQELNTNESEDTQSHRGSSQKPIPYRVLGTWRPCTADGQVVVKGHHRQQEDISGCTCTMHPRKEMVLSLFNMLNSIFGTMMVE